MTFILASILTCISALILQRRRRHHEVDKGLYRCTCPSSWLHTAASSAGWRGELGGDPPPPPFRCARPPAESCCASRQDTRGLTPRIKSLPFCPRCVPWPLVRWRHEQLPQLGTITSPMVSYVDLGLVPQLLNGLDNPGVKR